MTEVHWAVIISVISLVGQVVNAWLKMRMKSDLADFRQEILDRIDGHYVPREKFDAEVQRLDQNCILRSAGAA